MDYGGYGVLIGDSGGFDRASNNVGPVDGSLLLRNLGVEDAGLYECSVENETAYIDRVNLTVRSKSSH
ncbi:unnamed protein product [Arctia plantaginis]|uniref:Uncharacterized protein n=1 Tax=Arctia plantaginis TaxID=874455 RepID=A0A8S0Z623_ARCPL|nr:unnamed protein product [Arctia plantaginis]